MPADTFDLDPTADAGQPDPSAASLAPDLAVPAVYLPSAPPLITRAAPQPVIQLGLPSTYWRDSAANIGQPAPDPIGAKLAQRTVDLWNRVMGRLSDPTGVDIPSGPLDNATPNLAGFQARSYAPSFQADPIQTRQFYDSAPQNGSVPAPSPSAAASANGGDLYDDDGAPTVTEDRSAESAPQFQQHYTPPNEGLLHQASWSPRGILGGIINGVLGNTGDRNEGSQLPRPTPHTAAQVGTAISFPHRDGLDLPDDLVGRINTLYSNVGGGFVVTSGRRDANRQADAMYGNYAANTVPSYVNRAAASEVRDAYDTGVAQGLPRSGVVQNMADVLQNQMNNGTYVSLHETNRAMDIASNTPRSVINAIAADPSVQSIKREDTHWHVQFRQ